MDYIYLYLVVSLVDEYTPGSMDYVYLYILVMGLVDEYYILDQWITYIYI